MPTARKPDEKQVRLLAKGLQQGFVTQEDVDEVFPHPDKDLQIRKVLYSAFSEMGIAILRSGEKRPTVGSHEALANVKMPRVRPKAELTDDNNPVGIYLREIGRVPLLTADQEQDLGRRIREGQRAAERLRAGGADPQARSLLSAQVRRGDEAQRLLAEANLRLVVSVAKRYAGCGMSLLDLVQEGNMGLLHAVEKFDYTKGFKFSTYGTWWIRRAIGRAVAEQARSIRLPSHRIDAIGRLLRASEKLTQILGREPSATEIALEMGLLSPEETEAVESALTSGAWLYTEVLDALACASSKVHELQRTAQYPMSFDVLAFLEERSQLNDLSEGEVALALIDKNRRIGALLQDESASDPADETSKRLLREQMKDILDSLTKRERDVLSLRFGLQDGQSRTLEEVGKEFKITRERVRQIEAKALRKLRQPQRKYKLKDYVT